MIIDADINNLVRILDPYYVSDELQLADIITHYKSDMRSHKNQIYFTDNLLNHADWILNQFKLKNTRYFKIVGKFVNGELTQIMVGYVGYTGIRDNKLHVAPWWSMGLLYFKYKQWRSPGADFQQLAIPLYTSFENDNFNVFYTVLKLPAQLIKNDLPDYFSINNNYAKTLPFIKYKARIEHIFMSRDDILNYNPHIAELRLIVPRRINRPIVLLECSKIQGLEQS